MLVRLVIFCRSMVIFSNIYKWGVVVVMFLGTAVLEHFQGGLVIVLQYGMVEGMALLAGWFYCAGAGDGGKVGVLVWLAIILAGVMQVWLVIFMTGAIHD